MRPIVYAALILAVGLAALAGCARADQLRALRGVEFGLSGVAGAELGGVPLDGVRGLEDVRAIDLAQIGAQAATGSLPLQFDLLVAACNPPDNPTARLTRFDWTLFLNDRETASGVVEDERTIAPGDSLVFTVPVDLDLVPLFGRNARELVRVALSVAGGRADPAQVRVEARPTVETALGRVPLGTVTVIDQDVAARAPADTAEGARPAPPRRPCGAGVPSALRAR